MTILCLSDIIVVGIDEVFSKGENEMINIRIFNKDINDVQYFNDVKLIPNTSSFLYEDKEGNKQYVEIKHAMQETPYSVAGEPIYEKDVIVYMGEVAMVFFEPETRNAAIYYNDELVFLSDIHEDIELLTTIYDGSPESRRAIENWKENALKNTVVANILTLGVYNSRAQAGAYGLRTTDGVSIDERFKFVNKTSTYAELYCISEALIQMRQKGSRATVVELKSSNSFIVDIVNKPWVIKSWARNEWKTKAGKEVQDSDVWKRLLAVSEGIEIKASLISIENKKMLLDFINKK